MTTNSGYPELPPAVAHLHSNGEICQERSISIDYPDILEWPVNLYTNAQVIAAIEADRAKRDAEVTVLRKDAERYRWLEQYAATIYPEIWGVEFGEDEKSTQSKVKKLRNAIDAALAKDTTK